MDKQVIQSTGFRNIVENGEVTGFQFKVRLPYYRGIFLSQIRPGTLYVDGKKFTKDQITWTIKDEEYSNEEMAVNYKVFWEVTKPAVLKVSCPGGLESGYHDLTYGFSFTSSYMPPSLENPEALDPDREAPIYFGEFGHHVNHRRLIIV